MKTKHTLFILIAFCLALVFWFINWLNHPLPQYEGIKRIQNIKSEVDVYTDDYGVPHVFAKNEEDCPR